MKWISRFWQGLPREPLFLVAWLCLLADFYPAVATATPPTTFRQPHPLSWMHNLPTGEMPGWEQPNWFQYEVSWSNVWNAPLRMSNKKTGEEYQYFSDYEQITTILEAGFAWKDRLGITLEIPYANRDGGDMDDFIDDFHVSLGNRRFNRQFYDDDEYNFQVKTDDEDYYAGSHRPNGVYNLNLKLKYWMLKWKSSSKGACPCGVSLGWQGKFPLESGKNPGTTGDIDHSALLYIGVPLWKMSAMWLTAGATFLGDNPAMESWPRNEILQMYEINFDLAFANSWGLLLMARAESPFLDRSKLTYEDTSTNPEIVSRNRAASGWNALVHWRGTNSLGFRYRAQSGTQTQFLFAEDWGLGPNDASDQIYSNGSPDVNFIMQTRWEF